MNGDDERFDEGPPAGERPEGGQLDDERFDEPILSAAETEALLEAMREEQWSSASSPRAELVAPERALTRAIPLADEAATALIPVLRKQLLKQTGRAMPLEAVPSEITPYDSVASVEPDTLMFRLLRSDAAVGAIWIAPGLARAVLAQALGGAPDEAAQAPARRLSDLDRRLLAPFPAAVAAALGRALLGVELQAEAARAEPEASTSPFEPVLRVAFRAMPYGELVVALTSAAVVPASPVADPPATLAERLREVTVSAAVVFGRARMTLRALLELDRGDVVRLNGSPDTPIELCVGTVVHARGIPVALHGNHALEITERR